MSNRRGRKRKDGPRYESGRLKVQVDRGSEVTQIRRKMLAGDPDLAFHWLGVLRARNQISADEYRAGCLYEELYSRVYRRPLPSAAPLEGVKAKSGEDMTPEQQENLERSAAKLHGLMSALDRVSRDHGRRAKDEFDNLVLHHREPRWLSPVFPSLQDVNDARLFKLALEAVTEALVGRARKAAA